MYDKCTVGTRGKSAVDSVLTLNLKTFDLPPSLPSCHRPGTSRLGLPLVVMTIFVPLEPSSEVPAQPSFLVPTSNVQAQLSKAIQAIMKARRIVVICG